MDLYDKDFADKLMRQWPDKVPVVLRLDPHMNNYQLKRSKFLVDREITISNFQVIIRKYLENSKTKKVGLAEEESIFVFYGSPPQNLPKLTDSLGMVADVLGRDGFLHALVLKENTFGSHLAPC